MNFETILNQQEAAEYIHGHGIRMTGTELSIMTNAGGGPPFCRKGNQKLFLKADLDTWIADELLRRSEQAAS